MSREDGREILFGSTVMVVEEPVGGRFPGPTTPFTTVIDDPSDAVEWYRYYFVGRDHVHYMANLGESDGGVVVVSLMMSSVQKLGVQYRVIVWRATAIERRMVEADVPLEFGDVLRAVDPALGDARKLFAKIDTSSAANPCSLDTLLKLENDEPSLRIKIGVLFAQQGQTDETAMYQNKDGSPGFEEFLDLLGDRVLLKGFEGYAAQLDTKYEGSGTHSVYRPSFAGYEIMFHVSTLLQYDPTDEQRIQRKRFIGNDIIMIVFMDGDTTYNIECMASQYTRVVVVVQPVEDPVLGPAYAVSVGSMKGLRMFGPQMYEVYPRSEACMETLLAKCINGEKATKASPEFVVRAKRTRKGYLDMLYETFGDPKALRKKALKRDNDMGLIPVSMVELARSVRPAPQAFDLYLAMDSFPHPIATVECVNGSVLFGTPGGLYVSTVGSLQCTQVINMPNVVQILAVPAIDMLVVRTDRLVVSLDLGAVLADDDPGVVVVPVRSPCAVDVATFPDGTHYVAGVEAAGAAAGGGAAGPDGAAAGSEFALKVFAATSHSELELCKKVPLRTKPMCMDLVPGLGGAVLGLDLDFVLVPFSNFFTLPVVKLADTPPIRKRILRVAAGDAAVTAEWSAKSSAEVATALDGDAHVPSEAKGAFPLGASGETLLAFNTFGVIVSRELVVDKKRVLRWTAPPVHFFTLADEILVVVYHTFSEVYSLANGAVLETHLVTSPDEYTCRGNSLYLPSWVPSTHSCSLYRLEPRVSPSARGSESGGLYDSLTSDDSAMLYMSASNLELPSRRDLLTPPGAGNVGADRRGKTQRSASLGPEAAAALSRSLAVSSTSPTVSSPLAKSASSHAVLDSKDGGDSSDGGGSLQTKAEKKAAKKAAKAEAKAAKAEAKAAKAEAKAAKKAAKSKGKGKDKGKDKGPAQTPPRPANRGMVMSTSGALSHSKARPPGRARQNSRRDSLRERRRALMAEKKRRASGGGRSSSGSGVDPAASAAVESRGGGKGKEVDEHEDGQGSKAAVVDESHARVIDVESLAAQWENKGIIF